MSDTTTKKTGLELLRDPFPPHQISKLPKGTKAQNECPASEKVNCKVCGGWHHPRIIHLDYVGHAALTDRLLDCDPSWNWEPLAVGSDGYPAVDKDGGMWIKLTVCGVTRIGYGDAQGKTGGNAVKERIGDALRNAAMRFGAALDLWHKGELHKDEPEPQEPAAPVFDGLAYIKAINSQLDVCKDEAALDAVKEAAKIMCEEMNDRPTYQAILAHYKTCRAKLLDMPS
jgi:hypothetical protein